MNYADAIYEYLRANAGRDSETGRLVTHAPIQPFLAERFDIHGTQAQGIRTKAVKELEAQNLVLRDHPRTTKIWIL